ncbi:MAG: peptidoglycan-associated lipoprotein Pal [Thermodesulfovibrionia bacterium]|nr:MAG: peptidoglycan-associated lipoprotein Pal [Thermodesulfovibrionia bacterium]
MKKFLVIILMIFAVGCSKKYVQPGEYDEGVQKKGEVVEEKLSPEEARLPDSSAVEGSLFKFEDALFDFDRYNIRPDARAVLDSVAAWLNSNRGTNLLIEGNGDERGTNEYNLALGEKRAKAARDYLISRGIASRRINHISYGEEKPVCTEKNEACWQSNRRAHFVATR